MKNLLLHCITIVSVIFINNISYADLNRNLVSYWSFDQCNATDDSGNGNDGILINSPTCVDGISGKAFEFNGISSTIKIPNFVQPTPDKDFSIALWAIPNTYTPTQILLNREYAYELAIFSGGCSSVRTCDNDEIIEPKEIGFALMKDWDWYSMDFSITTNTPYFIVITYDSENNMVYSYVNGRLTSSDQISNSIPEGSLNDFMCIGSRRECSASFYSGTIDEIRIYSRNISENEILQLFNMPNTLNASVIGKVITSSEILSYTANVGGATVKSFSNDFSTTTNIYGEFELSGLPLGSSILEISSSYFKTVTSTVDLKLGENNIGFIKMYTPKCSNMYTEKEIEDKVEQITTEKDTIIQEQEYTINQLNATIQTMYTESQLNDAIADAEKRGELKYDINNDGKVGIEEVIKYLETLSGVRLESLIIVPE